MPADIQACEGGVNVGVYATPGARKTLITGVRDDGAIKVTLSAPADRGRANRQLVTHFARLFGDCQLVSGALRRRKTLHIPGKSVTEFMEELGQHVYKA